MAIIVVSGPTLPFTEALGAFTSWKDLPHSELLFYEGLRDKSATDAIDGVIKHNLEPTRTISLSLNGEDNVVTQW